MFFLSFSFFLISIPIQISYIKSNYYENETSKNINRTEIVTKINYNSCNNGRNLNEDYQPIRILTDLSHLIEQTSWEGTTGSDLLNLVQRCLERVKNTVGKLFYVQRKEGILIKNEDFTTLYDNGFKLNIFDHLKDITLNYDLIIFLRHSIGDDGMDKLNSDKNIFARPKIIRNDEIDGRPIIGYIIIGSNYVNYLTCNDLYKEELVSSILLHEFLHILGFMEENGFTKFPNYSSIFSTINNNTRINEIRINKKIVISKKVVDFAKIYFNCSNIQGIELENLENLEELKNSHWEGRILLGDIMTSKINFEEQVISEFTLLLLEESGWYKTNNYTGGLMRFGKSQGCKFLENDCITIEVSGQDPTAKSEFPNDFCSSNSKSTCSAGRMSRGICDLNFNIHTDNIYSSYIRTSYDRFKNYEGNKVYYGYGNELAEFCPKSIDLSKDYFTTDSTYYYTGNCKIGNNSFGKQIIFNDGYKDNDYSVFSNDFGEGYGNNSFCALSSILNINDSNTLYKGMIRPTCYNMFCSNRSLTIKINNLDHPEYIVCPRSGNVIYIEGPLTNYIGYLFCPDYNLICTGTEMCNNMFDCVEKESRAKLSSFYNDYNKNITSEVIVNEDNLSNSMTLKEYELSNNGVCPINCRHCIDNYQCILCRDDYFYIGTAINDQNPIICNESRPINSYYLTTSNNYVHDKTYFRCIDNCYLCTEEQKDICEQCAPTHKINSQAKKCEERIPKCLLYNTSNYYNDYETNGGAIGYKECLNCNNSDNYFCVNGDKTKCILVEDYNNKTYFKMENREFSCIKKCSEQFSNICIECNRTSCKKCSDDKEYIINDYGLCIPKIKDCISQRMNVNYSYCSQCAQDFYCIENKINECQSIDSYIYYYNISSNPTCIKRCNNTFDNCEKCNKDRCTECKEGYFVIPNGTCMKNITGCINNVFDGTKVECYECNRNKGYYCFNNTKSICHQIDYKDFTNLLQYYYYYQDNTFSCYETCNKLLDNCLTCNETLCFECTPEYIINHAGNFCYIRPFIPPADDNCTLKLQEIDLKINKVDPWNFTDYYWDNIPYIKVVNHYVGENYTVTVFVHSECTEDLYDQGYFKLDTKELEETMIKEAKPEPMEIIFATYIIYNHKSYLGYFDIYLRALDPYKVCPSCFDVNYTVTNRFYEALNNSFGQAILSLVYSENLDILSKESDFYNDICKNVTFYGIDMPLKERLHYLYLYKYLEPILCNSENCTIEEYFYENSSIKCKCSIGNIFEDILTGDKIEYIPYEEDSKSTNNFIDSLQVIKCAVNGFKIKNFKSNYGIYICIGFIAIQIGLLLYYFFFSKPLANLNKSISLYNPPKKSLLKIISEWERSIKNNKSMDEEEIFVQPRDEADDQLLEEERSFSNEENMINISGLSIDTNVGGAIKNISTGNKLREKLDNKRVLILLSNRGKNKSKKFPEEMKSESDIIPQIQDENENILDDINFGKIYWHVLSLKQHIINFFSGIKCCKITESFFPLSIRILRSLFMIILSFVLNILWLDQIFYTNKFEHFNKEYTIVNSVTSELNIPLKKKIIYSIKNTFKNAFISFCLLVIVQFILGIIFFSARKNIIKAKNKKSHKALQEIMSKVKTKNIIFFIMVLILMFIFLFTLAGFIGAYGGGFVDYFTAGIISLLFLEIFPFIWSLIIALLKYLGIIKNNKICFKISQFFMF